MAGQSENPDLELQQGLGGSVFRVPGSHMGHLEMLETVSEDCLKAPPNFGPLCLLLMPAEHP